MSDAISSKQFRDAAGTGGWRVVGDGAKAHFATGSFTRGAELVAEISRIADDADHHPDVDLRYGSVTVRLISHDVGDISERDIVVARRISAAARELGIEADPARVQSIQLAIDAVDVARVLPFWLAVLDYTHTGGADIADPRGSGPNVWFQQLDAPRAERNTVHVDVFVPRDQFEARLASALAAGGSVVDDSNLDEWVTLADPEGNLVDLAPWRDDSEWQPE